MTDLYFQYGKTAYEMAHSMERRVRGKTYNLYFLKQ